MATGAYLNLSKECINTLENDIIGIYELKNTKNNKRYVGKSRNIKLRLKSHLSNLISNNHINQTIQNDFNNDFQDSFVFKVLVECQSEDLERNESLFAYQYETWDETKGYNITKMNDYSKISKEDAVILKDEILNITFTKGLPQLPKRSKISIPTETFSKKMNILENNMRIALKEVTETDEEKYNCFLKLESNYTKFSFIIEKGKKEKLKEIDEDLESFYL